MRTSILTSCHLLVVAMLFLYLISPAETLLQLQHATHARVPLSHPTTTMRPRRLRRLGLECTAGGFAKPKGFSSGEPPPSSSVSTVLIISHLLIINCSIYYRRLRQQISVPAARVHFMETAAASFTRFSPFQAMWPLSFGPDIAVRTRKSSTSHRIVTLLVITLFFFFIAFATGNADFLIDTTYHTQKDYKRHAESSLDPKKARKAWGKEIKNKNTDIFEFLKLEMLDIKEADPSAISKAKEIGDAQTAVFRIIVRLKSDKSFVYFKVLYSRDTIDLFRQFL